jgi:type IV secretory pathway TrbD component
MFNQQQKPNKSKSDLMRYAGLGMQLFVSLGLAVFAGYKLDKWIAMKFPVFVWVLPLVVLFLIIYKLIKETSKRNDR